MSSFFSSVSLQTPHRLKLLLGTLILVLALPVILILLVSSTDKRSHAASTDSLEAEGGVLSGNASLISDGSASNGQAVMFGTKTSSGTFQPSAPYYAAFYYPWFKNQATDGSWTGSTWSDPDAKGTHSPPANWFSNYLPDPNPSQFDPSTELYSSDDYTTFKWQVTKMAEAKVEVALSSWWAQGHKTDTTFNKIITDFMPRPDNPYPNLRWGLYYECEGNTGATCNNTSNPSVSQIVNDLNYLKTNYSNSPYMLKINGKLVMFVYGDTSDGGTTDASCSDSSMTARWKQANNQVGNAFYIVLKVFPGYATDPCQPDEWHQYAPASRQDSQGSHSFSISPGFWRSGDPVRLGRDLASFQSAANAMVASSAKWRLITTWNEWGEGTAVEPGTEVIQTNGTAITQANPSGTQFGNAYIDALKNALPPLEAGVGSQPLITATPTPAPTQASGDPVIVAAGDISCGTASTGALCKQMETSNLFTGSSAVVNPNAILLLGDNQYESGELADWLGYFDPSWGRAINKEYPAIGNHEYDDPAGGAKGTFDYFESKFGGPGNTSKRPGARNQGYYSFDIGTWHLIALNTQCTPAGGCSAGSPQEKWLRQDLAAHSNKCILAFYHIPLYSSGGRANQNSHDLWQALYDYHADVILTGHDHSYERFAPMDANSNLDAANGIVSFVVGTGGREFTTFVLNAPNSVIRNNNTMGVLKMTLHPSSYDFQFIRANFSGNGTFTDSGSGQCH